MTGWLGRRRAPLLMALAFVLLGLLAVAVARWEATGVEQPASTSRAEPLFTSESPDGVWTLSAFAYEDLGGATGHTWMWAEVRGAGTASPRAVYDGHPATVTWRGGDTAIFTETGSSATHAVDVRTGDYGVTPTGTFERGVAWAQIVGAPLLVFAVGAGIIIFARWLLVRRRRPAPA